MVRVLHVFGRTDMGGAENRVMDLYRSIDRDKVQFDFIKHTLDKCAFDDEIESLGGHVYNMPRFKITNYSAYRAAWERFFESHPEISVVHGHMTSTAGIYLPIAKKHGVRLTIAHSRSAGVDKGFKGFLTKILRRGLVKKADLSLACSREAALATFGQEVQIIPNTIKTERFAFNPEKRKQIRDKYGIDDSTFLVGHVGRFHYSKNHEFLLDVFAEIKKLIPDSKLMLVGDGDLRGSIEEKIKILGIEDDVILTGIQRNVEDFYQAFDYFLFPSRYEGLPGTVVEAQTCGLKCLISDTVTKEVVITDLVTVKHVSDGAKSWAERIVSDKDYIRENHVNEVREAGFDSLAQLDYFTKLYTGDN